MTTAMMQGANFVSALPTATGTKYIPALYSNGAYATDDTAVYLRSIVSAAGVLSNFSVNVAIAPGADKSWTFTLVKNGTPTTCSVAISGTSTTGQDTSHPITVAAGDTLTMKVDTVGTAASNSYPSWVFTWTPTTAGETSYGGGGGGSIVTSGYFLYLGVATPVSTEGPCQIIMPCAGTWKNLHFSVKDAPGAGKNFTITARKGGVDQALAAVISGTATTGSDTAHSFTVAAGDLVSFKATSDSTSWLRLNWAATFVPDDTSQSVLFCNTNTAFTSSTTYGQSSGDTAWGTTEIRKMLAMAGWIIKNIYAAMPTAPGTGKSCTFSLRTNGGDASPSLSAAIADAATQANASADVTLADWDVIDTKLVTSGSPSNNSPQVSYLLGVSAGVGDITVLATTDELTLTENSATISNNVNVSASKDALTLTEYPATTSYDLNVSANVGNLTLTANAATVSLGAFVNASCDSLTVTANAARITHNVNIACSADALILTEYPATLGTNISINAASDSLTLTTNAATVSLVYDIAATSDSLVLTENSATVDFTGHFNAKCASLTLTENAATIVVNLGISALCDGLTLTEHQALIYAVSPAINTGWMVNKGACHEWIEGFVEQPNKWGYLNNPNWVSTPSDPVNYTGNEDEEPVVWEMDHRIF